MSQKNIILIGMAGGGKSSAGKVLAQRLQCAHIETDERIAQMAQKTIAEIFTEDGEEKFRTLESKVLNAALSEENSVISTGGGVILSEVNCHQIRKLGWAVYLAAPLWLLQKRLTAAESAKRPLLKNASALSKLLQQRETLYQKTAHLAIAQTDEESPLDIAKKIQAGLKHIITP
ncbi:MAG: shikimate kinase [Gammaproteobacteria bacterium WSBS_2016_MAG_OTU1]